MAMVTAMDMDMDMDMAMDMGKIKRRGKVHWR